MPRRNFKTAVEAPPPVPDDPRVEQELAWIGDAVLSLFARRWVLSEKGRIDTEMFKTFTSNRFLGTMGRPTRVEAEIGQIYRQSGEAAAFAYIEARLIPLFRRQRANQSKGRA